jgi:hypothetical protein
VNRKHSATVRPPLTNLETVCLVAQEGSFSAAAPAVGTTHGVISRRIGSVANWLGFPLFERHGRGVRLARDGQRFVGRVGQAFSFIDGAIDQRRERRAAKLPSSDLAEYPLLHDSDLTGWGAWLGPCEFDSKLARRTAASKTMVSSLRRLKALERSWTCRQSPPLCQTLLP